ncbi:uncharacterized protein BKCO1_470001 [Diplodia corticola]|uniref:Uncharacterized protein n=1 Tax=Diplodia corticola TaxID=236234 RepID=A0A1J9RG51_9PEZI|nr:uncharacterized protein BKCO1_470001 [Diplodia corticola]OJD31523.1 hypothetical protein BKCO1_470001 [Diplodia corticola]
MAAATRATAVRAGRKRSRISYREPSTSDDEDTVTSDDEGEVTGSARKRMRRAPAAPQSLPQETNRRSGRRAIREDHPPARNASTPPPVRSRSHGLLSASPEVPTKLRRLPEKSYHLPSAGESDGDTNENEDSREEGAEPSRPRRTGRRRIQRSLSGAHLRRELAPLYTETNSEDTGDISERRGGRVRNPRRLGPKRVTRSSAAKQPRRNTQSKKLPDPRPTLTTETAVLESDGVIPDWANLPYEVLLEVFMFASDPLHDDDFIPTPNIAWLASTARVCKTFLEPALTALYRSPPLLTIDKPHRLLDLLSDTTATHCINYNVKIRRLEFDAPSTLAYTWAGRQFEIGDLVPFVPQLTELSIVHPQDRPPFRTLNRPGRWHYSQALFTSLAASKIRLKSWNWNSNFRSRDHDLFWMGGVHQLEAFQRLEHLSLFNFGPESFAVVTNDGTDNRGRSSKQVLADNLALLPELKSLSFESCQVLDGDFLPLLKENLQHLAVINCHHVTSEVLRNFLVSHGTQLESLILNHNQALDISFLPDLKRTCPRLEVLKMDLNYFDSHDTFRDSEPKYIDLLKDDEIPSWPATLQIIELNQLRQWTSEAAENFFSSLLDSAEELPDLRRLVLKAILNIGWRDRATFRDKWIGRLQRVFLRKSSPPNPHFMSGKRWRMLKESTLPTPDNSPTKVVRRLRHVAVTPRARDKAPLQPTGEDAHSGDENPDDSSAPAARRLRPRRAVATNSGADGTSTSPSLSPSEAEHSSLEEEGDQHPTSDDGGGTAAASSKDWKRSPEKFIQGMCEVVDIRIDNLRPREEQFNENDFLDSEVSGDEDWNGEDNFVANDGYAW